MKTKRVILVIITLIFVSINLAYTLPIKLSGNLRVPSKPDDAERRRETAIAVDKRLSSNRGVSAVDKGSDSLIQLTLQDIADNPTSIAHVGDGSPGMRSVKLPEGKKILVFETIQGDATCYQGDFLSKLEAQKNSIELCTLEGDVQEGDVLAILNKVKPTIVMLPYENVTIIKAIDDWASQQDGLILGIGYATTKDIGDNNLYVFYSKEELDKKMRSISAHKSQVERVPFDEATRASNRANAIIGQGIFPEVGDSDREEYAEVFEIKRMANGKWRPYKETAPDAMYRLSGEGAVRLEDRDLEVFSPHMDDTPIGLGVLAQHFDGNVTDCVMATGHRAFIDGIDNRSFRKLSDFSREDIEMMQDALEDGLYLPIERKIGLEQILRKLSDGGKNLTEDEEGLVRIILSIKTRERETIESDRILGIRDTLFCRFPLHDHTDENGERILGTDTSYDEIEEIYHILKTAYERRNGKLVVAIPSLKDLHPDHRATYRIVEEALIRLTEEYNIDIPVILYVAPWFGEANVYNYISREAQIAKFSRTTHLPDSLMEAIAAREEAYGITGGELVSLAFGAQPDYDALGSTLSERVNVFWLNQRELATAK